MKWARANPFYEPLLVKSQTIATAKTVRRDKVHHEIYKLRYRRIASAIRKVEAE
jgi:hypothetical protein